MSADDLDGLADDLAKAGAATAAAVSAVVRRGAINIKRDWRASWAGMSHAPALPYSITYDTVDRAGEFEAEVGPDKGRPQGALGNLLEFGSVNNGPRPGGQSALDAEEPRFIDALGKIAQDIL